MRSKAYRVGKPLELAAVLAALALCVLAALAAWRGGSLLHAALDGRRIRQEEAQISPFSLREQMYIEQAEARVRGWLSVVDAQQVSLNAPRGKLAAAVYPPLQADEHAPWALVLHGGLGTDRSQVLDVACMLSLEGYRVLTPDLYAHGKSEGSVSSLGLAEAQDVLAWLDWIALEDADARIVIFGQDEGGVAALLAAGGGLPDRVTAIAVDSVYVSVKARAQALLEHAGGLERRLYEAAYHLAHGVSLDEGDIAKCAADIQTPLLLLHGTGDSDVLAWQSEDIALAAGEHAQLMLIEGAGHGRGRFLDPKGYYDALLAFYGAH